MNEGAPAAGAPGAGAGGAPGAGAGRGRGYQGRNPRNRNQQNARRTSNAPTFKGSVKEMNGHVFQCYGETSSNKTQFNRTIEELDGYVGINFKHSEDIKKMVKTMEDKEFTEPKDPKDDATKTQLKIWEKSVENYVKRTDTYEDNKSTLYSVLWGQCSDTMKTKIRSITVYDTMSEHSDSLTLLKEIKGISYRFESKDNLYMSMDDAKALFYTNKQAHDESNADYLNKFKDMCQVIEHYGGSLCDDKATIDQEEITIQLNDSKDTNEEIRIEAKDIAKNKSMAMAFLKRSDKGRYGQLLTDLKNQYSRGTDQYPVSVTEAYNLLVSYKKPETNRNLRPGGNNGRNRGPGRDNDGQEQDVAFAQQGRELPLAEVTCFNCQQLGHYAGDCTNAHVRRGQPPANGPAPEVNLHMHGATDDYDEDDDEVEETGFSFNMIDGNGKSVSIEKKHILNPMWILLDSASTVSIFANKSLLRNIRHCGSIQGLKIHTNGGVQITHLIGDLPGFGPVWYDGGSLANILSLAAVRKKCRITMDTKDEPAMIVHKKNGEELKFIETKGGLYYYDIKAKAGVKNYSFVTTTVEERRAKYTRRQIKGADAAWRFYSMIGRPGHAFFIDIIRNRHGKNCPITEQDANIALDINGTNLAAIRGKTTRQATEHVQSDQRVPLPPEILAAHKKVCICMDYFFIDKLVFFITVSRNIHFISVENVLEKTMITHCLPAFNNVNACYKARGFVIDTVHADDEFKSLKTPLLDKYNILLNVAATNEHVPEVERMIRVVKERIRCTVNDLPFKRYPIMMKRDIVKKETAWINMFPHRDGVSARMSPRTIVTGLEVDFATSCKVPFGAYCEVHDEPKISNTETSRTTPAIALIPTGNAQGGYFFMSLKTGKRLSRRKWTELPTTQEVIDQVHALAINEDKDVEDDEPTIDFKFSWDHNHENPIEPFDYSVNEHLIHENEGADTVQNVLIEEPNNADDISTDHNDTDTENANEQEHSIDDIGEEEEEDSIDDIDDDKENNNDSTDDIGDDEEQEQDDITNMFNQPYDGELDELDDDELDDAPELINCGKNDEYNSDSDSDDDEDDDENNKDQGAPGAPTKEKETEQEEEQGWKTVPHRHNTRGNKRDFSHLFNMQGKNIDEKHVFDDAETFEPVAPTQNIINDTHNHMMATKACFAQLGTKAGIKEFGQEAVAAIMNEVKQLEGKKCFKARAIDELTRQERERALRSITLVTKKRSGKIKGRTVADGRGQRDYIPRDEITSPTVSTEALMISLAIDAHEGRKVSTADVEGAYLHADMDEKVIMKFEGDMVDYLIAVNPEYEKFVHTTKNGKRILYVQLLKALYGCMQSALLWFKLFTSTLVDMGFEINPYDMCVANKIINGKQCTICWYVDDLKISHMEQIVINSIIIKIEERYGKMTVTHGDTHTYVGMDIHFKGNREVTIAMIDYLTECIEDFGEDCSAIVATPAGRHVFESNPDCLKLSEERRKKLHSIVAKLLFVAMRARPDIQVPVSYLTSRVTKADEDDWKKLKRMLQYIHSTINMKMTLSVDDLSIIKTWVDASYATHADMKSHTGANITLGKGTIYARSLKQKLNTKSSTEAELVGASDICPQAIWTKYFIEAQGYKVKDNDLYQDNMSAQRMEKNGRKSAGQKSRHINIRYFFIKDRVHNGELNIIHCPTAKMIGDFFTKPLQGTLFKIFRDIIMGIKHFSCLDDPNT
jgi:hypothetical protein